MAACDDRQLTEAQRVAGYQNQRTGVQQAIRPFSGRATPENIVDYINRELFPAVKRTRDKVNDVYLPVVDNAPSGNPLGFYFSTETGAADPTAGRIRCNAATQDTATILRVSESNGRLANVAPWLDVMAGGATTPLGVVTLTDAINPSRFIRFDLNTMVDQGVYWDLGVTPIESSHDNPFVDGGAVVLSFIPAVSSAGTTIPPSAITPVAANTVIANATSATAAPTAFAVGTNTVLGRVAGNIVAAQLVNAQITDATIANAKLANMAVGTMKGRQIDAGSTGVPVDLTGLEQAENWRRGTIQTVSGVSGTLDIQLNDDTTVLLIRTTGNATLRTLETSTASDSGREIVIEHDRLSGTGILTIAHNTTGTYSTFFNPDTGDLYLGQTTCCTVRFRSGFWRPQGSMNSGFVFPGSPIYDVMRPPYNAVGDGVADDTAAINAAIAAANAEPGDVYFGNHHLISGALTALTGDAIGLIGRGCRGDGTLITATGATPYNIITIDTAKDCIVQDMFIEGPGTWASRGLGIFIDNAFRTRVERVEIEDTYGAIEIYASTITEIIDTYAASIYGDYAFYAYGSLADGENHAVRFRDCATGSDVTSGAISWYKQGSGSHTFELINCGALHGGRGLYVCDDTAYGSDSSPRFTRTLNFQCEDAEIYGIHLEAGATASFTHTLIISALGDSFHVDSTYSGNFEINGGMIHGSDGHGVSIACDHWSITGLQVGNIDAGFDCINVGANASDFSITGCSLGDIFGTNSGAAYGINIDATCTRYTISGNRIIGNDTGAINDGPGPATSRVIQGNNPTSVNTVRIDEIETMAVGTVVGRRVDAGSTGRPAALTGAEQAENWRRNTIQTESGVSGTLDILLNDDTTVLLIRTTADATLRSLGDGLLSGGREIVIEHDRLSGSGNLTVQHNTAGTYSSFFNPDVTDIVLGQTTCATVRLRSGFWRPQTSAGRVRVADYGDITVSAGGTTWTIDNDVVSDAKLRNSGALSVIGRSANSSGDPADISATAATGGVLRESGSAIGFGTVATAGIADAAVTLAKLANLAVGTVIGRAIDAGSTGVPTALTGAQQGQQLRYTSVVTDTTSSGAQATYTIAETTTQVRANTTGDVEIRGMTIPTAQGQRVVFHREPNSTGVWTFTHNSGGGTTQQQLFLSNEQSQVLGEGQSIMFEYTNNRWRHIGGTTSTVTDGDKGDVTVSAAGATWTIDANVVTDAKFRQSAALSVVGRSANSTGNVADISASAAGQVLRRGDSSNTLVFATVSTLGIEDAAVTLAKQANLAQSRIIGRAESAGTGVPTALTPTEVVSIIDAEAAAWTGAHTFSGPFRWNGVITPTVSTSPQNDWSPSGLATANVIRVNTSTASITVTGIAAQAAGTVLVLINVGNQFLILANEDGGSTAANRIVHGLDSPQYDVNESAVLWYDGTSSRWRLIGGRGGSG